MSWYQLRNYCPFRFLNKEELTVHPLHTSHQQGWMYRAGPSFPGDRECLRLLRILHAEEQFLLFQVVFQHSEIDRLTVEQSHQLLSAECGNGWLRYKTRDVSA